MLAPGGEVTEETDWSRFALRSHRLYPAFIDELRHETGCPIDYQRDGGIEIATTDADWLELRDRAKLGFEDVGAARVRTCDRLCGRTGHGSLCRERRLRGPPAVLLRAHSGGWGARALPEQSADQRIGPRHVSLMQKTCPRRIIIPTNTA